MSLNPCIHCLAGKQHRASFQYKAPHKIPRGLYLEHYNVYGPNNTSTLEGERYFVTFNNDHSQKV